MALLGNPELLADKKDSEEEGTNKAEADGGRDEAVWSGVDHVNTEVGGGIAVCDGVVGAIGVQQHDIRPDKHRRHGQVLWQLPGGGRAGAGCGCWQLFGDEPWALLVFLHQQQHNMRPSALLCILSCSQDPCA